jgi:mRNA-degrading endonuclease RelE of RelBE toxin-antitoxin system
VAWTLIVAKPAQKQAASFPARDQAKIAAALSAMTHELFAGDVLKLEGEEDRWRRRVGNYRIFLRWTRLGRLEQRYALGNCRPAQIMVKRRQTVAPAQGDFKIGRVVGRQTMLAAERLCYVEHDCRSRTLVHVDR